MIPALLTAFAAMANPPNHAAPTRPNLVLIMTDDQGYGDFSCHGNPVLKTPNLNRLAEKSIRLTDFHVAPSCTPTRGQLMTGLDALRNGANSPHGQFFLPEALSSFRENCYCHARGLSDSVWEIKFGYPNHGGSDGQTASE